jgi:energy-coupling factor transporter ATP-binding protein EcfA2
MPEAARAPVKPRILSPATRAALPLEDEVQSLLDQPGQAIVALCGGPGTGKSIALAHLAAVFPHASRLRLIDERDVRVGVDYKSDDVIVFVGPPLPIGLPDQRLVLAPWRRDELIEYMLVRHPVRTASVISRIFNRDIQEFVGTPNSTEPLHPVRISVALV